MPDRDDDETTPPERPIKKLPRIIDEGWPRPSSYTPPPGPLPEAATVKPIRMKRRTLGEAMSTPSGRIATAVGPLVAAVLFSLTSYVESCNTREKTDQIGAHVPKIEKQSKETDSELDNTYKTMFEHLKFIEAKIEYMEKRQALLEQLVVRTSSHPAAKRYKPPKAPAAVSKPAPALPSTPTAAPVSDGAVLDNR